MIAELRTLNAERNLTLAQLRHLVAAAAEVLPPSPEQDDPAQARLRVQATAAQRWIERYHPDDEGAP